MKRGFTLIEITAVVLILGMIFLISFPTFSNILKKSEEDKKNLNQESIIQAAKTYINLHKEDYDFSESASQIVLLIDLVNENLIEDKHYDYLDIVNCKIENGHQRCILTKMPTD